MSNHRFNVRGGRNRSGPDLAWNAKDMLEHFPPEGEAKSISEISRMARVALGTPASTFQRYKNHLFNAGFIATQGGLWYRTPKPFDGTTEPATPESDTTSEYSEPESGRNAKSPSWLLEEYDQLLLCFPIGRENARSLSEIFAYAMAERGMHRPTLCALRRELLRHRAIALNEQGLWYRNTDFVWRDALNQVCKSATQPCFLPPVDARPDPVLLHQATEMFRQGIQTLLELLRTVPVVVPAEAPAPIILPDDPFPR